MNLLRPFKWLHDLYEKDLEIIVFTLSNNLSGLIYFDHSFATSNPLRELRNFLHHPSLMDSLVQRRTSLLSYLGSLSLTVVPTKDFWARLPHCQRSLLRDCWWPPIKHSLSFKDMEEDKSHPYLSVFDDHLEREGVLLCAHFVLSMRVEKWELPRVDLILKSKTLINHTFDV